VTTNSLLSRITLPIPYENRIRLRDIFEQGGPMRVFLNLCRGLSATAITGLIALLSIVQAAQPKEPPSNTNISNFGCINENFYRGAQPNRGDFSDLAAMGVKTIIDLQEDGERNEQQWVEASGMKFFRIGMSDSSWPSREKAQQFLKLVNDSANQPVFIHCHGGRHRAGIMTAIYRMTHDAWSADRAYAEMKQYGFEKGFGHGSLKDYVYDYYAGMVRKDNKNVTINVAK
jgi:protein tyrosine/serine phosphatase